MDEVTAQLAEKEQELSLIGRQITTLENEAQDFKSQLMAANQSNAELVSTNERIQAEAEKFYRETTAAQQEEAELKKKSIAENEVLQAENDQLRSISESQRQDIESLQEKVDIFFVSQFVEKKDCFL